LISTVERDESKSISLLKSQFYFTDIIVAEDILILSCQKCLSNYGTLSVYDKETFNLGKKIDGDALVNLTLDSIALTKDIAGAVNIWFTAVEANNLVLKQLFVQKDPETSSLTFSSFDNRYSLLETSNIEKKERLFVTVVYKDQYSLVLKAEF